MDDPIRATRLTRQFEQIIRGQVQVTPRTYALFLEAICIQPDSATCVNKLLTSPAGLSALQSAMRVELTPAFCNGLASQLMQYLTPPELASIGGGEYLKRILLHIVEPPIFWSAFVDAFRTGQLHEKAQLSFAWLLLQLISLQFDLADSYLSIAQDDDILNALVDSPQRDVRAIGQKIKHVVESRQSGTVVDADYGPGGRHDNDKADFRQVAIVPTADEITSKELPFLRTSSSIDDTSLETSREAVYFDNHFRLLREDMLYEMREELASGKKRKNRRGHHIDSLRLLDVHHETEQQERGRWKGGPWAISLERTVDFPELKKVKEDKRRTWFKDNRRFLSHRSMASLLVDDETVAFATINRDEELLAKKLPVIVLHLEGEASIVKALLKLKSAENVKLVQIDTAIFAYEPVLKALQEAESIPLLRTMLYWREGSDMTRPHRSSLGIVKMLEANPRQDLQPLLQTAKSILLDSSQSSSLLQGLTQTVSLIQGPPGTGKSFIGALLAKALHDFAGENILVVCYTNHALDAFLEDLLDIGIPSSSMLRLGGKSTTKTAPLALQNVQKMTVGRKFNRDDWQVIDILKRAIQDDNDALDRASRQYMELNPGYREILDHLEFEDPDFYFAFLVPASSDGMQQVTRKGKAVGPYYLLHQWTRGWDAGQYRNAPNVLESPQVWSMPPASRIAKFACWKEELIKEHVSGIYGKAKRYNDRLKQLDQKFDEETAAIIASKRIIGCTTTAAAKYRDHLKAASPGVLLVEEAGEILESHIVTALAKNTKQLILIGDHQQLRPKVNNYMLTVEKGEGYDLNRSLFERLVRKGYPHKTLSQQHRMRPEISALVRHLTYPDLVDAPSTMNRPNIRGVRDNVVFIHHEHPEDDLHDLQAPKEQTGDHLDAKASKKNVHEVNMVLKIVRYLGQQGYGTEKLVILTPYLGQLRALQQALATDNDPILNDLDSADLVRAGLLSAAAANISKKPIRLATIDNYQGEESDIVIASLTRSNSDRNIGFMSSPERVNVLLSRARNALIMIGNAHTFQTARSGKEIWIKLFGMLKDKGHLYDGLPIKCERHPDRVGLLRCADDFDQHAPDGGCTQPCGSQLKCGHQCTSKCHQIYDHSKMPCETIMYGQCPNGHRQQWKCQTGPRSTCIKCDKEAKAAEKRRQEDFALQEKRDKDQREHARKIAEIDSQIAREREVLRDTQLAEERKHAIEQKNQDLRDTARLAAQASSSPHTPDTSQNLSSPSKVATPEATQPSSPSRVSAKSQASNGPSTHAAARSASPGKSESRDEWERQKNVEGVTNEAIDAIMEMSGLENVKAELLNIKNTVDTAKRQGMSSTNRGRYNTAMLGNPGTGKTTVARHYGRFLASVQVLSGNTFIETTGSRLANDGVPGIKKTLEGLIEAGGGTIFCDEAYQLISEHNFQGRQVLDFLLAEMENNVGRVVFIFAGYNREMEKFFEHNPGLKSRVPYTLQFQDYEDDELLDMLANMVSKTYNGRMKVEDGIRGLYARIAVRRLGRSRGRPGFGNARALSNLFDRIRQRQALRLKEERRRAQRPDDFLLTKEDLIGPDPSTVMIESKEYKKLQSMIGLGAVKKAVENMFTMVKTNYDRELLEKAPHQISLNRVFLGSPGTGKTTIAKLYGCILADLGMISNGEVVVKNPADFIGSALGQSESQTKAILANTEGKVLVIDEAYMLYGGNGSESNADPYKTAVIDTIVAEVQSVPGEDRCVLLLGYKKQIEDMFQNVNPGLSRRFAIEDAFHFDDYNDSELLQALELKLKAQDLAATDDAKKVAIEVLSRARNRPNFGNIGEVENLLTKAKTRYQERQASLPVPERSPDAPFEPRDFDPEYDRSDHAGTNLAKLFEDVVGSEDVVQKLAQYQQMARTAKARGIDPRDLVPTNFVFKGPPGTGKTTTARKMGQVFYDLGFLSSTEVIECSASDLVGQYVGQTGPKCRKLVEKALSRVLFIDEAYRLSEGHFAKEAVDELVGLLTQEAFRGKLIVVLAGYDQEMNDLLAVNTGLSSRFPDEIIFRNMPPTQCLEVLRRELKKQKIILAALDDPASSDYKRMEVLVDKLAQLPSWGNARDLKTLSKKMVTLVFTSAKDSAGSGALEMHGNDAIQCIESFLAERRQRTGSESTQPASSLIDDKPLPEPPHQPATPKRKAPPPPPREPRAPAREAPRPPPRITRSVQKAAPTVQLNKPSGSAVQQDSDIRDAGVTDAVWSQLQRDKQVAEIARAQAEEALRTLQLESARAATRAAQINRELAALKQKKARDAAEQDEVKRQLEEARLREAHARAERARYAAALEAQRKEEERKRQEEAKVQAKLRQLGICPMGFQWIKQASGYRCSAGGHFVDNMQLGI